MLVLTRKADEQILIGDDIKITLVRVRGNSVRVGIDAPKNIRIVRGELRPQDASDASEPSIEREEVFARPEAQPKYNGGTNRIAQTEDKVPASSPGPHHTDPHHAASKQVEHVNATDSFVQPASSPGSLAKTKKAPLSAFVSAT